MRVPAPDRPILGSRLPLPDRLLLWALRAWVIGLKQRLDAVEPIRSAFAKIDVPEAAELVDALMSVVACGAARTLTIECVCHQEISEDERHLLTAASLHQQGRGFEARLVLRTMLSPRASADAAEMLSRLGALLAAAGLTLSSWPPEIERYVLGPAPQDDAPLPRPRLH